MTASIKGSGPGRPSCSSGRRVPRPPLSGQRRCARRGRRERAQHPGPAHVALVAPVLPARAVRPQPRAAPAWPFGLVDFVASGVVAVSRHRPRHRRAAERVGPAGPRAGVLPADGKRRVILYMHGGAFLTCGVNSHSRISVALSKFADSPVLVVDYRLIPNTPSARRSTTATTATAGCGCAATNPTRSCWPATPPAATWRCAGPAAAGRGRGAAALVAISPLLQLDHQPKLSHPEHPQRRLVLGQGIRRAGGARRPRGRQNVVDGEPEGSTNRSTTSSPACRAR